MVRRAVVATLVAATVALAGVGVYSEWQKRFGTPHVELVEPPKFVPPDAPPAPADRFADLAATDPVGMFAACLAKYEQEAKGFRAVLAKRERIRGKLQEGELVRVAVWGDVPGADGKTAVRARMIWDEGARKDLFGNAVRATAYVEGANHDQILTFRPTALLKDHAVDLKGAMARDASRYCMKDSGVYRGMLRTYDAWKKRKEAGELKTEYLGKRAVPEVGGRECHVVRRTCVRAEVDSFALDEQPPTDPKILDRDGFAEVTVMIDAERRLQVGTVIRRADGELVGEYYFRDVALLTAEFPPETFTPAGLRN